MNITTPRGVPTQDMLRALILDPDTGHLTWLRRETPLPGEAPCYLRRWNNRFAGAVAGDKDPKGYIRIRFGRRTYQAHRVVWMLHYGSWPDRQIDHINGRRDDNRIANLRQCTSSENQQNLRTPRVGKLGRAPLGVTWHRAVNKWQAQIKLNGRSIYLGVFDSADEAHAAYLEAKRDIHPFGEIAREVLA